MAWLEARAVATGGLKRRHLIRRMVDIRRRVDEV
jgi:hypothetical protein